MELLNSTVVYSIADTLAMEIKWDSKAEKIRGKKDRLLKIGDLLVPLHVTIVDSKSRAEKVIVLVRVLGNLMLLITASIRRTRVYIINAAKYNGDANDLLTALDCYDHARICKGLGKAAVQAWESASLSKSKWIDIELASTK